jgi:hypothetical protein
MSFALIGCGPGALEWTAETDGCPDYDFDAPTAPALTAVAEGADTVVVEFGCVLQPADAAFEPELTADGKAIEITERWTSGDEADFPFLARVRLENLSGELQIYWFRGDDDLAFDNVSLTVD